MTFTKTLVATLLAVGVHSTAQAADPTLEITSERVTLVDASKSVLTYKKYTTATMTADRKSYDVAQSLYCELTITDLYCDGEATIDGWKTMLTVESDISGSLLEISNGYFRDDFDLTSIALWGTGFFTSSFPELPTPPDDHDVRESPVFMQWLVDGRLSWVYYYKGAMRSVKYSDYR